MKKDSSEHNCGFDWFPSDDLLNQLVVILVGVVLLLVNFGFMDSSILAYWPALLIVIGLREMVHRR